MRTLVAVVFGLLTACVGPPNPASPDPTAGVIRSVAQALSPTELRSIGRLPTLPGRYEAIAFPAEVSDGVLGGVAVVPGPDASSILLTSDYKTGDIRRMSDGSNKLVARFPEEGAGRGFQVFAVGDVDGDGGDEIVATRSSSVGTKRHEIELISVRGEKVLRSVSRDALGSWMIWRCAASATSGHDRDFAFTTIPVHDLEVKGTRGRLEVVRLPSLNSKFVLWEAQPHSGWGRAVCWFDDFDRDGAPDLLVSAPRYKNKSGSVGRLYLISGRDGHEIVSWSPEDLGLLVRPKLEFAAGFTIVDDLDGDGTREVVVVADLDRSTSAEADDVARIVLVNLRTRSCVRDLPFVAGDVPGFCSPTVTAIDDFDDDGYLDVLVTCTEYTEDSRDRLRMRGSCTFTSTGTGSTIAAFTGKSDYDEGDAIYGVLDASTRTGGRTVVVKLGTQAVWLRPRGQMR